MCRDFVEGTGDIVVLIHGILGDGAWMPNVYNGMLNRWVKDGKGQQIGIKFVWQAPTWIPVPKKFKNPGYLDAKNSVTATLHTVAGWNAINSLVPLLNRLAATKCPISIIGHSQGTMVALGALATIKPAVKNVVLLNSPHHLFDSLNDFATAKQKVTGNFNDFWSEQDKAVIWVNQRPFVPKNPFTIWFAKGWNLANPNNPLFPQAGLINGPINIGAATLAQIPIVNLAPGHSDSVTWALGNSHYAPLVESIINERGNVPLQNQVQQIINATIPPNGPTSATII